MRAAPLLIKFLVSALALLLASGATAIDVPHIDAKIVADGKLDEPMWQQATMVTLDYESRPGENTPAPVKTEVFLAENGDELMVAFRAYDPEPDKIVAYLQDRDSAYNDDFVGIVLDTFNDERRAFEFFVNALGIQMDLTNDDVNGRESDAWDAIWDSAGRITEEGFIVEMVIPFRTMQFPAGTQRKVFGVDLLRFRPRADRVRLSHSPQDRDMPCYLCQLAKLEGFEKADPGRNLVIVPSATMVRGESSSSTDSDATLLDQSSSDFEPALDVSWGITPDVSLTATLNPDFSQVEADSSQLQINQQFALFFPEQRPFFLEGQDFFATPLDAVFTRNVADPDYGVKLTGKSSGHTYAGFAANDTTTNLLLPGALGSDFTTLDRKGKAAVARYAYDIGDNSRIGGLLTSRQAGDYSNTVGGLDGRFRFAQYNTLTFQYLASQTDYPQELVDDFSLDEISPDGGALRLQLRRNTRGANMFINYDDIDRGFRADMGFMPQVDYSKLVVGGQRRFHAESGKWWHQFSIGGDWDITHDQSGQLLERELEARAWLQGAYQSYTELATFKRARFFDDQMFNEKGASFFTEFNLSGAIYAGFHMRGGDQIDFANSRLGKSLLVSPRLNLRIGKGLSLRFRHTWQSLDYQGDNVFKASLSDIRTQYQFSSRQFLRLVMIHREVRRNVGAYIDTVDERTRTLSTQLLYSYKINPQTVFFLGYGDNQLEDDRLDDLSRTDRALFMKISYAWQP